MLIIEDGNISLTRGDTAYLALDLTNNDEPYELKPGYEITLSCRRNQEDTNYLFQKKVTEGTTIIIEPDDTKDLDYGRYKYDIQITTVDGEVFTIMLGTFKITEEVTL